MQDIGVGNIYGNASCITSLTCEICCYKFHIQPAIFSSTCSVTQYFVVPPPFSFVSPLGLNADNIQ